MFENRVLRRIFGPKRDEVTRGSRELPNEVLHNLYTSSNIIRMIKGKEDEMDMACSTHELKMHIGFLWRSQKERED
jgi:hypothetical protein